MTTPTLTLITKKNVAVSISMKKKKHLAYITVFYYKSHILNF